jgi:ABC-type branched-subunit amino acid transport system ATPase component
MPAQLAVIVVPDAAGRPPIADLAAGLLDPASGTVCFQERPWQGMNPFEASSQRGRIGRVFEENRWISNLTVSDNLILQQRHHSGRGEKELLADAASLARLVGLPAIPPGRPEDVRAADLRRLQWVRAFLGMPRLVLMEKPESGIPEEHRAPLIRLIEAALARGTSVVWQTTEGNPAAGIRRPGVRLFRLESGRLTAAAEAT